MIFSAFITKSKQSRNKELEMKYKEMELRYLEEKQLREQAESKVALLLKEVEKYTFYDSNEMGQDSNPNGHNSPLALSINTSVTDNPGDQQDFRQERIESCPVNEKRFDVLTNNNNSESIRNTTIENQVGALYLRTVNKSIPVKANNTKPQPSMSATSSEFDPFNNDNTTDLKNKMILNTQHQRGISVHELKSDSRAPENSNIYIPANNSIQTKTLQTKCDKAIESTAELVI